MEERQHSATPPIDPDIDFDAGVGSGAHGGRSGTWRDGEAAVLCVISAGGVLGAVVRYEASLAWPTAAGAVPWTTLTVNVAGCALIGVLLVLVGSVFAQQRLLRPFLGTGVLGGFTTFSTYAVDIQRLIATGHPARALSYLIGTVLVALAAVTAATWLSRHAVRGTTG